MYGPTIQLANMVYTTTTYLGANNLPLVLFPILVREFQCLDILVFPDAELFSEPLVAHLESSDLEVLALFVHETGGNVFPGNVFVFFELHQKAVVLAQICLRRYRGGTLPALSATANAAATRLEIQVIVSFPLA